VSAEEIILNDEEQPCLKCGGATDTGWECTECGFDNRDWYYPDRPPPKPALAECKAGNLIDVNGPCKICGAKPGGMCGG
jgi:hypothetical protein